MITFGPIVTATASAKTSTPFNICDLESAPNVTSLAYERCDDREGYWSLAVALSCCDAVLRRMLGRRYMMLEVTVHN